MRKRFIILTAFIAFFITACSESSDSSEARTVLAALLSSEVSGKVTVTVEFSESRTLMPSLYNQSVINWASAKLFYGDKTESSTMQKDLYNRYHFQVEAGKTYDKIEMIGTVENSDYQIGDVVKPCTVTYKALMENVRFDLNTRNTVILPYSFVSVEFEDGVDYYNDALEYGGSSVTALIAQVKVSSEELGSIDFSVCRALLYKRDNSSVFYEGTYDPDSGVFKFSLGGVEELVEGLYDFELSYNKMCVDSGYPIYKFRFSNAEALYIVRNNYVDATGDNSTFKPILDKSFYIHTFYTSMNKDDKNDGSSYEKPIYVYDALKKCVDSDIGLEQCYIYCGSDFILDWNALYSEDKGIFNKMEQYKEIHIITPRTKYVMRKGEDDPTLTIYGNEVALRGTGSYTKFEVDSFWDYDGTQEFRNFSIDNGASVTFRLYDGASLFIPYDSSSGSYQVSEIFEVGEEDLTKFYSSKEQPLMQNLMYELSSGRLLIIIRTADGKELVGKYETLNSSDPNYGTYFGAVTFSDTIKYWLKYESLSNGSYCMYFVPQD